MASPDYHDLAKCAKDIGSAAVLVSILVVVILWGMAMTTIAW
jgi:diacylglycerol kinase